MHLKKYILVALLIACLAGCRSISVNKSAMRTASTAPVALGVIGTHTDEIIYSDFQGTTIPIYKKGIRVSASIFDFDASTYKAYTKASKDNPQQIQYIDSLDTKPKFITLEIIDWVAVKAELTDTHNRQSLEYLKNQNRAKIIASISIAVNPQLINEIDTAEALFLINRKYKQYELSVVKDGKPYRTIDFSEATIFGFQLFSFCWGENKKRRIELFDIVNEKNSCPKSTYKSAKKAKEKINYLKL